MKTVYQSIADSWRNTVNFYTAFMWMTVVVMCVTLFLMCFFEYDLFFCGLALLSSTLGTLVLYNCSIIINQMEKWINELENNKHDHHTLNHVDDDLHCSLLASRVDFVSNSRTGSHRQPSGQPAPTQRPTTEPRRRKQRDQQLQQGNPK